MQVIGLIGGLFGGGASGGSSIFGNSLSSFGGGSFPGFAEGGYVTGPTKAIVGEGGEPEYVIPESKMTGAMQRWNGGTRGGNVVSGADSGSGGEGSGFMSSAPTNVVINGGVMQMGGNDYIRKDEIPSIVAQASKQGEARTLRRLQMSPGTRRKLGM
jgi:SLT domain-containing protein